MTIRWNAAEQYFTAVLFVFQFYPVCYFGKFLNFGLVTVRSERVKSLPTTIPSSITWYLWCGVPELLYRLARPNNAEAAVLLPWLLDFKIYFPLFIRTREVKFVCIARWMNLYCIYCIMYILYTVSFLQFFCDFLFSNDGYFFNLLCAMCCGWVILFNGVKLKKYYKHRDSEAAGRNMHSL